MRYFISVSSNFITGQSKITASIFECLASKTDWQDRRVRPGWSGLKSMFSISLKIFLGCILNHEQKIYLVNSRSVMGFLRDCMVLFSRRFNVKIIAHSHGSDILELLFERKYSALARFMYTGVTIITPSHRIAKNRQI